MVDNSEHGSRFLGTSEADGLHVEEETGNERMQGVIFWLGIYRLHDVELRFRQLIKRPFYTVF